MQRGYTDRVTMPDPGPPPVHVRTRRIPDPGPLAHLCPGVESQAWLRGGDGMIAFGEAARHKASDIADADEWWSDFVRDCEIEAAPDALAGLPGCGLVAFGAFLFDPENSAAQSVLTVPSQIVGRHDGTCWVTTIGTADDPVHSADLPTPEINPPAPHTVSYADGRLTGPEWEAAVAEAVRRIEAPTNPLDKVVLARDLLAFTDRDIDVTRLVDRLSGEYARCWTYLVDGLVGATPEMLVRRQDGLATSRVLAGTIRRTGAGKQDLALAAALSRSSKDLEEHEYAVSSVARVLAEHCSGMNVPDSPYVLELPNVLHLATDVTAVADHGASALALAAALHPSAAVCGTPTDLARTTLAELEVIDRERYAGPVGWIDATGDGEWAIALRCGQLSTTDPRQIRLFAGCGIVADSDPEAELAEAAAKFVPMRDALEHG